MFQPNILKRSLTSNRVLVATHDTKCASHLHPRLRRLMSMREFSRSQNTSAWSWWSARGFGHHVRLVGTPGIWERVMKHTDMALVGNHVATAPATTAAAAAAPAATAAASISEGQQSTDCVQARWRSLMIRDGIFVRVRTKCRAPVKDKKWSSPRLWQPLDWSYMSGMISPVRNTGISAYDTTKTCRAAL